MPTRGSCTSRARPGAGPKQGPQVPPSLPHRPSPSSFPPALLNLQDKQPPMQGLGKPRSLAGGGRHRPAQAGPVWTEEKVGGKPLSLVCSGLTQ